MHCSSRRSYTIRRAELACFAKIQRKFFSRFLTAFSSQCANSFLVRLLTCFHRLAQQNLAQ